MIVKCSCCMSCIVLLLLSTNSLKSIDSLQYKTSLNYFVDLSNSYGGGQMLSGGFTISKKWIGINFSFGHFQSHQSFSYIITIEELSKSIEIQFDELATMQMSSLSIIVQPIQNRFITSEIYFGLAYGNAKYSRFDKVDYSYSFLNNQFNYLYKDYKMVKTNHFGYQFGLDVSYFFLRKIGMQLSARAQDLSNGGTFFFVGGGLCFKL